MAIFEDKVKACDKTYSAATSNSTHGTEEDLCFVVRGLPHTDAESKDTEVTKNKVQSLLKDGMGLNDIQVDKADRKKGHGGQAGAIIVKVATIEQRNKVLKHKRGLKDKELYKRVYINPALTKEVLSLQNNFRTILREIGKDKEYIIKGANVVKKKSN